jgi:hypothetical protein
VAKTMQIEHDGRPIGSINMDTAALTTSNKELASLYGGWQHDGFRVLGPPATPPPEGVLGDSLHTVFPQPETLGLVVGQLLAHGYRVTFLD